MSQYLLSVWHDEEYEVDFTSDDMARIGPKVGAFNEELEQAGALRFAGGLEPASTATVIRADADHNVARTEGPYAKSKEQMGGFWAIEASDFDAAIEWARKATIACEGPVELRPFQG